eukprot:2310569-Prymnesium_polylepis.1
MCRARRPACRGAILALALLAHGAAAIDLRRRAQPQEREAGQALVKQHRSASLASRGRASNNASSRLGAAGA